MTNYPYHIGDIAEKRDILESDRENFITCIGMLGNTGNDADRDFIPLYHLLGGNDAGWDAQEPIPLPTATGYEVPMIRFREWEEPDRLGYELMRAIDPGFHQRLLDSRINGTCISCGQPFRDTPSRDENIPGGSYDENGRKERAMSGMCGFCWDAAFDEDGDERYEPEYIRVQARQRLSRAFEDVGNYYNIGGVFTSAYPESNSLEDFLDMVDEMTSSVYQRVCFDALVANPDITREGVVTAVNNIRDKLQEKAQEFYRNHCDEEDYAFDEEEEDYDDESAF